MAERTTVAARRSVSMVTPRSEGLHAAAGALRFRGNWTIGATATHQSRLQGGRTGRAHDCCG